MMGMQKGKEMWSKADTLLYGRRPLRNDHDLFKMLPLIVNLYKHKV